MSDNSNRSPWAIPIVVALIGAAATVTVALINRKEPTMTKQTSPSTPPGGVTTGADPVPSNPNASGLNTEVDRPRTEVNASSGTRPLSNCTITINFLYSHLMSEPSNRSVLLGTIKPGEYEASEYKETLFAGQKQGWFKIHAVGRVGWVVNDGINIAQLSSGCP